MSLILASPSRVGSPGSRNIAKHRETDEDRVNCTVWDEPALSRDLVGETPADAITYSNWIEKHLEQTSVGRTWLTVLVVAAVAGPWALFGGLFGGGGTIFGLAIIILFGPVLEEVMKVAAALWVVEKRPFLFRSRLQIAICVLASAFVFSAVENLLYLNFYIPEPSALLTRWRWVAIAQDFRTPVESGE